MKEDKGLLLILLSIGLICTWIYHFYDKSLYSNEKKVESFTKNSDSLLKTETNAVLIPDTAFHNVQLLNADTAITNPESLKNELSGKLAELYRLQEEINKILNTSIVRKEDLLLAREKTAELQLMVDDLKSKNQNIEKEKQKINTVLLNANNRIANMDGSAKPLLEKTNNPSNKLPEKTIIETVNNRMSSNNFLFTVSEIRLSNVEPINNTDENVGMNKANKMHGSFSLMNKAADIKNAEIFIVIIKPNGIVLNADVWESFSMETQKEGVKKYTKKFQFEYKKGETKRISFSLNEADNLKGNYQLQFYQNGQIIGQLTKLIN